MIDYSSLELEDLEFYDAQPRKDKLMFLCNNILRQIAGFPPTFAAEVKGKETSLVMFGNFLGFKDSKTLCIHDNRLKTLSIITRWINLLIFLSVFFLLYLPYLRDFVDQMEFLLLPISIHRYTISDQTLHSLKADSSKSKIPSEILDKLKGIKNQQIKGGKAFKDKLIDTIDKDNVYKYGSKIRKAAIIQLKFSDVISLQYLSLVISNAHISLMIYISSLLLGLFIFIVSIRIAFIICLKYFVQSLCVYIILSLLIDLKKDNVLIDSKSKRLLIRRMNYLTKVFQLLPLGYANNDKSMTMQNELQDHFNKMSLFVHERARWAIAPLETTLKDLERDFNKLAPILIKGNYGECPLEDLRGEAENPSPKWRERAVNGLPRFMGLILPLILMGWYIWKPQVSSSTAVTKDIVTYIFIAWLLLAIDANLKLGIVASLTDLAKGIKALK